MEIFHTKPKTRKLARAIIWAIPAFTLPFFVIGLMASKDFWLVVVIVYSAFVVGLGYCDTHLTDPGTAPSNTAKPAERLQFAMGFYGLQIFVAPIILILIGGLMFLGLTLVSKILGF
jgi:hypothetical protein